ncbi:DacC D-alanyl-D-alanine carboxypeptidase [Rhabdaerophilaceae bacterium]
MRLVTGSHVKVAAIFFAECVLAAWLLAGPAFAQVATSSRVSSFETAAKQAILIDFNTKAILFERNADQPINPASLVKLMTVTLAFREVKEGRLRLEQDMIASTDAWRRGGAVAGGPNMLITPNKVVKVGDLLTGLVVGAANDAAIVLAENISGTESRFVEAMNSHSRDLGLTGLAFRNATGFAADGQTGTVRDLARLAIHLIETYPDSYPMFAQRDMPFGRNRQVNRNPLLTMDIGADGLMTGSTPDGVHHIAGSAVQEGRRLVLVIGSLDSVQERSLEARKLMEWGFRRFELKSLFSAETRVGEAAVYGGASGFVPLKVAQDLRLPVLRSTQDSATLRVAYRGPIRAPIAEGQAVARLEIMVEGRIIQTVPLVAAESVARGSVFSRAQDAIVELSRQGFVNSFRWFLDKSGLGGKPGEKKPSPAGQPG